MTTLAPGQLVEQIGAHGRIWQIVSYGGDNWSIRLHADGGVPHTTRHVGELTSCTEHWLQLRCRDWAPPRIEPPCGDGIQTVRLLDGPSAETRRFDTAAEMIEVVTCFLQADHARNVEWFGWDGTDSPDMTAEVVDDEVVWADA